MNWPVVPLGDVAETALGKMLDRGRSRGHAHVPYLRNINVQWGRVDTDDLLTMELADDERERFGVREGDLLVCEGGEIGRCAIWRGREDYIAYQKALHRIRPSEFLDTRFLRYLFEHHSLSGTLAGMSTGTTIAHLPQQQLRRVPVPLPPVEVQRRIVDLLEDHLSRLDAANAYLAATRRRSEAMVMSSMAHAVAAASRTSPMTSVGAQAEFVEYGTSAKCGDGAGVSSSVPVLRMGNLKDGEIIWDSLKYLGASHPEFPKLILAPGDLLFNRTNSAELVGKSAVYESGPRASFASYLIRVRFRESVDPRWANIAINSPQGRAYVGSVASQQVGQANVNGTKLKAFPLPLPSIDHQLELIAAHDAVQASARRLSASASLSFHRSTALRRALLAAAFSGRLTGDREVAGV
jgi:type I restriction enzyme, S subunit